MENTDTPNEQNVNQDTTRLKQQQDDNANPDTIYANNQKRQEVRKGC